jgi:Lon protease-like protein
MMMRVFEPRYKQMLDDIVLDGLPYGHVISNPSMPELNGVSVPYDVGVLVKLINFRSKGLIYYI